MLNNKILIIDDDELMVHSIRRTLMLEDNDYDVISASNGKEGLDLYRKFQPVLVLLDLHMPVMGGVEFLEQIKISPAGNSAVIVLTGHSDDEYIKTCFDLGVSSFIRKPFSRYEFIGQVKQMIAFKKIQQALKEQCESQLSAQCHCKPQQKTSLSARAFSEAGKNISASTIGIDSPLYFTSF